MNLIKILDQHALAQPDHIALKDHFGGLDRAITYRQLQDCTEETAGRLLRSGVKVGQRLLLIVPLSIETYILLLAIFRIGAVAVIADSSTGLKTLRRSLSSVEPDAIISSRAVILLGSVFGEVRNIKLKLEAEQMIARVGMPSKLKQAKRKVDSAERMAASLQDVSDEHPALITFTSGSTGQPKTIVRSHGFLLHQNKVIANSLPGKKNDVELTTLPVFVLSALAQGITAVLPDCDMRKPASLDARRIVLQLNRCNINRIIASPSFLKKLSDYLHAEQQNIPFVQNILTGGGPVFPSLLKKLEVVFPNAELTAVYGSTEAEPIAHITNRQISREDLSKALGGAGLPAGKPIDDIELAIADPVELNTIALSGAKQQFRKLPAFSAGEILVTGQHVIKTYLNGQGDAETKLAIKSHDQVKVWHRTGDAGYLDDQGRLWLLGRCASKISDRWGSLYPFQVEVTASEIDSVERATCLRADGKRILVVEKKHRTAIAWASEFLKDSTALSHTICEAYSWLYFDEIKLVHAIPVDLRHHSKIQYGILEERIKHPWLGIALNIPAA